MTLTDKAFLARYGAAPADVAARLADAVADFEAALARVQDRWLDPVNVHVRQEDFHGEWSPAQQAEHVLRANTGFGKIIHLLNGGRELPPIPREPGPTRDGRPVAPPNFQPGEGLPWESLEPQWREAHQRLLRTIGEIDPENARTFWHPYFGDLGPLDWARVTVMHTRRHLRQLGLD